ncbi:MAG: hypothetical protein ACLGSD_09400 [Acidobacteriota bacterium]
MSSDLEGLEVPRQELFFERNIGDTRIEVLKTYDRSYAREVFDAMSDDATNALAAALDIAGNYDASEVPDPKGFEYGDFLWQELCSAAVEDVRLDPNLYSFFVVCETRAGKTDEKYVSPDWPSAEKFANSLL